MSNEFKSIEERKQQFLEDCCGMVSAGDGGFTSEADAEGPVAGYDPLMKTLKMLKRKRGEKKNTK